MPARSPSTPDPGRQGDRRARRRTVPVRSRATDPGRVPRWFRGPPRHRAARSPRARRPSATRGDRCGRPDARLRGSSTAAGIGRNRSRIEEDTYARRAVHGHHTPQHHGATPVAREGQCFAALDNAIGGDPAAAPDERALLVVTSPHEPQVRWPYGVPAASAEEAREDRLRIPARSAHPDEIPARADEHPAFTVRQQRVLA